MTIKSSVAESSSHLRELVDAAVRGEEVLIVDEEASSDSMQRVLRLVVISEPARGAEFGSGKGLYRMSEDFDEPLPDFEACQ